ncbi:MAG: hypothetical protein NZ651_06685 [Candidatus Bipolaricaulota bacterium]|nr:hypothetical protein [Candidatus Bipolaricaulota bacterium]MDW8127440.1 hypothetical protein [Candidatus Bipolaricaulota bacterium]
MRREEVPLLDWLGYKIRAVRLPIDLPRRGRCIWYRPNDKEPWDLIAWKAYNDEELWYIIADVNGVSDPFVFPSDTERLAFPELY